MSNPTGLTARIAGSHPAGPGSTPGVGMIYFKRYDINRILFQFAELDSLVSIDKEFIGGSVL